MPSDPEVVAEELRQEKPVTQGTAESMVALGLFREISFATKDSGNAAGINSGDATRKEDPCQAWWSSSDPLPMELLEAIEKQCENNDVDSEIVFLQPTKVSHDLSGHLAHSIDAQPTPRQKSRPGSYRGYSKGSSSGSPSQKPRKWCGSGLVSAMSSRPTTAGDIVSRCSFSSSSCRSWQATTSPRGNIYMPPPPRLAPTPPLPPLPPALDEASEDDIDAGSGLAKETGSKDASTAVKAPPIAELIKRAIQNPSVASATPPPVGRWRLPATPRPTTAESTTSVSVLGATAPAELTPSRISEADGICVADSTANAPRQQPDSDECTSNINLADFSELALSFTCLDCAL